MDLDSMIFSTGSTFIFGSWICEADDNGKLQSHLLEDSDHPEDHSISATTTDQLTGRFVQLAISDSTQISRICASNSNSGSASKIESYPSSSKKPSSFPMGLKNIALAYQEYNSENNQSLFKKSGLFRSDSTTRQHLIRHGLKDPLIWCLECHWRELRKV